MIFSWKTIGALSGVLAAVAKADSDFPTIEVVGNKFFYSNNGSQFYIRGVAYQADTALTTNTSFVDPLADKTTCERDVPILRELNTNVIRVYALDADEDHTDCMTLLQDAGIYVIADLAQPKLSISTTSPEWSEELYERYTSVIDEMQQYNNVLGFFAGNEVITNSSNTDAAPFVKAAVRDMKQYMKDKGYRSIPVGYSANDDSETRVASANYFACGDDDERADFYGINMYEWCGNSSFSTSGYEDRTKEFSNLTIPVFFSEYGCNTIQPRRFTDIPTIFSDEMTDVWSGGIVYMYFEEDNNYGLVSAIDDTTVSTMTDFQYYSSEINNVSPTTATVASASSTASELSCPTGFKYWNASDTLPPTPEETVCDCMASSLKCVVSDDVDSDDYEELFGTVCGLVDCGGITANGKTGKYGAYSFCSSKDMLSFALNLYYLDQDENSSACDFDGSATVQSATTASSCSSILSAAGTAGTGTVSGVSGSGSRSTASGSSGSSSGSSSTSSSSSSSSAAARSYSSNSYYTILVSGLCAAGALAVLTM
ncbi:hypothetical protein KL921_005269 [Ogataea angusta]|uniref:1,3-beta-glucanosyltransferase n=1 Tax=Pichia angusta TaxID=870730 RepID=A0ABQ7RPQ5_PICAN|nr:hypothetical protein KL921_005269 [Ogataea angusta]KAG7817089.1 hypothetical protein KL909_005338 [Ogataea angusta]KAG7829391.1 hypothetical protein KL920_002250 [Ogataea angusta]KAG7835390.1 hypothetical protein KL942_005329 [Ogataea angusta]KAG7838252.1 hypothetical protein KL943_000328 [Ogataea angusta]